MSLNENDQSHILLGLMIEYSTAMRERSQPEYLYTAAAVAGFGATSWGVAALPQAPYADRCLAHPAIFAAAGIFITAILMIQKILRENESYKKFKILRANIAASLKAIPGAEGLVPGDMLNKETGPGAFYSAAVVAGAAICSIIFSISTLHQ